MKNTYKPKNCKLTHVLISFILLFLLSAQIFAQQETNPRSFSIHAGVNGTIFSNATGPSISIQSASRTDKVIQRELMLFFDKQSGGSPGGLFPNNDYSGIGLAAGVRINIFPQRNWNPSFVIMLGPAYGSESAIDRKYEYSGLGYAFCFGYSNIFYKKHMLSIGFNNVVDFGAAIYIKYGFWF